MVAAPRSLSAARKRTCRPSRSSSRIPITTESYAPRPSSATGRRVWQRPRRLRAPDRSVSPAETAPVEIEGRLIRHGELRRKLLVQVDPEPRLVVRPEHALLQLGRAGEDFARGI